MPSMNLSVNTIKHIPVLPIANTCQMTDNLTFSTLNCVCTGNNMYCPLVYDAWLYQGAALRQHECDSCLLLLMLGVFFFEFKDFVLVQSLKVIWVHIISFTYRL